MKQCLTCKSIFKEENELFQYCSLKCANKIINCLHCGKEFIKSRTQKYCSLKCYNYTAYVDRPLIHIICAACKKEVEVVNTGHRKYCSNECMQSGKYRKSEKAKLVNQLSEIDKHYYSGLIESEGSILFVARETTRGFTTHLRFSISNTDLSILTSWAEAINVFKITDMRQETGKHKKCYIWQTYGAVAEAILKQFSGILIDKEKQCTLALEFQEAMRNPSSKQNKELQNDYLLKMRQLNKRGRS